MHLESRIGGGGAESGKTVVADCGHGDAISYDDALQRLHGVATQTVSKAGTRYSLGRKRADVAPLKNCSRAELCIGKVVKTSCPIIAATGQRSACDVKAPHATPTFDTSAMDGFAVESLRTANATPSEPVVFGVVGMSAAGTQTSLEKGVISALGETPACVEIMTGARFPDEDFPALDAVVKIEDVRLCKWSEVRGSGPVLGGEPPADFMCIVVSSPVRTRQHRRPAGSDFSQGDLVVRESERMTPNHVMALASLGYGNIEVLIENHGESPSRDFDVKLGVLATGSELFHAANTATSNPAARKDRTSPSSISNDLPNSNGPYICSALKAGCQDAQVVDLGTVRDKRMLLHQRLVQAIKAQSLDVLITSGGVSMGRFDLVRSVVEEDLEGDVVFHGVRVRPGLPVLFAVIDQERLQTKALEPRTAQPGNRQRVAFFGLPGNPIAAAAALQFFVIPYLRMLEGGTLDSLPALSMKLKLEPSRLEEDPNVTQRKVQRRKPAHLTSLWLARMVADHADSSSSCVEPLQDQASYKVKNLLMADCWVSVPEGIHSISDNDSVQVVACPGSKLLS